MSHAVEHRGCRMGGGAYQRFVEIRLCVSLQQLELTGRHPGAEPVEDRRLLDSVSPERVKDPARVARLEAVLPSKRLGGRVADSQSDDLSGTSCADSLKSAAGRHGLVPRCKTDPSPSCVASP